MPCFTLATYADLLAVEARLTKLIRETMPAADVAVIQKGMDDLKVSETELKVAVDADGTKSSQAGPPKANPSA
jgi:hypothetical protein